MRCLRVIPSMDPVYGGPAQGVRNSIPFLEKLGIINEVVCLDHPEEEFIKQDSFLINAIGKYRGLWAYNNKLLPWLFQNLPRFDVVIIHGLWQYHSYAVWRAVKMLIDSGTTSPRVFVMPHGMLDPYFQKAPERRLKALRNWMYWHFIEKQVVNCADGILFTCEEELILARETFKGYRPKRQINIGYGIQAPPTYHSQMHAAFLASCPGVKDSSYFLYLSRIHSKKGTDLLIQAYIHLQKNGAALPKLVIAGPGMETSFGRHVKSLGAALPSDILFSGMLTGDAKWGAFYGCEAFILPSHQENFGIAVVEALACSKPVLITDKVNIWKEIKSEGGGLVGTDTQEGVYQLLYLWQCFTVEEQQQMGKRGCVAYRNHFEAGQAALKLKKALEWKISDNAK